MVKRGSFIKKWPLEFAVKFQRLNDGSLSTALGRIAFLHAGPDAGADRFRAVGRLAELCGIHGTKSSLRNSGKRPVDVVRSAAGCGYVHIELG